MRWVGAILFLTACATVKPEAVEETPALTGTPAITTTNTPTPASTPVGGVIARSELAKVLDASPGMFLQHVESEPRFRAGKFFGWKLVAFFPGDARFAGVDLRAGDVVTRVNGIAIERPEQLMDVWKLLRSASELTVDVERDGALRTLRWQISP
jgi:type II secretory pathway component PulC